MTEKNKTNSVRRTPTPKKGRPSKSPVRGSSAVKPTRKKFDFYGSMGNEITGIILIGLGLLLTAGIFTDKIGKVGEFLKNLAIATFGSLGYIFPIMLIVLGTVFILRRRGFLMNRRGLGALLILLSLLIALSVGHLYLLEKMSLSDSLKQITFLTDKNHGGVAGFLMAYPFTKLFGNVGAYIFSFLGMILGAILMLNTTVYDSLRKGKEVTSTMTNKISDLREKNREMAEIIVKPEDKQGIINKLDHGTTPTQTIHPVQTSRPIQEMSARDKEKEQFTFHSYQETESRKATVKDEKIKDQTPADPKISLPAFLDRPNINSALRESKNNSVSRFNIELKSKTAKDELGNPRHKAQTIEQEETQESYNPITVPYLESWNKVRDQKNPRLSETDPDHLTETTVQSDEAGQFESDDQFCRVFMDDEPMEDQAPEETPLTGKTVQKSDEHQSLKEFQDYRRNKLASTEKPVPVKGKQLEMDDSKIEAKKKPIYKYPGVSLLKENVRGVLDDADQHEIFENARKLQDTLATFGVDARVIDVSKGPSVTRYELQLKAGIKVSKVTNLADDIAMSLAASGVRIEAPIPGKAAVGIEIPNKETVPVFLREVIDSEKFNKTTQKLAMGLGKDISGEIIIGDITKFPHVLIAGATGSGKSVCINSLIVSLLYKYTPEEVRLIMVDPKMVELSVYNGIPHLLIPVVTDPKKAAGALNWAVNEMTRRYDLFNTNSVRNIEGYNDLKAKGKIEEKLPYIVIIVDELADLMMVAAGEVENYICRLAQMARAAGMHLVIATQRPSVDVITGVIKANIPSRISFAVSSYVDSKTILDQGGAEKLLGKGDMLYSPMGAHKPKRVQGAFISEEEVEAIVSHIKVVETEVRYDESIINHIENSGSGKMGKEEEGDELFEEAVRIVIEHNQASTSFLQRKMRIGYNRAARIIDDLEQHGVISGPDGAKPRKIIWTKEDLRLD